MRIVVPFKLYEKKVPILDLSGKVVGEVTLPKLFSLPIRKDLIRRAFLSAFTARLQPKGRDPLAGKRRVGESWGIGYGLARVPRLDNGRAVFAPMTRGGRLAHPPRTEKVLHELVNKKERIRAILSALAATSVVELVRERGHVFTVNALPVITVNDLENVSKTSEARNILRNLGLWDDVVRASERTRIRAGKGKMRGRRYVTPKSILIIVSKPGVPAIKSFSNFPGVDVVASNMLSVLHLAPGGVPGRLTVITVDALEKIRSMYEVISL